MRRNLMLGAGIALLLFMAVAARVQWGASTQLAAGREALAQDKPSIAQTHFLRAARWYLPLVPTSRDAVRELLALGDAFLEKAQYKEAVAAFDDARGALYATAWLAGPDADLLAAADAGYARSLAHWREQRAPGTDVAANTARYAEMAANVDIPSPWWSLLMGLAFLGYAGALAVTAWQWDRSTLKRRTVTLSTAGASFALWILAMTQI